MKSNKLSVNLLFFCYAFFTFAVFGSNEKVFPLTWVSRLFISAIFYIILVYLFQDNRPYKPLCIMFLLIYTIYLIAVQISKMCNYMRIYHGQGSAISTAIISALIILVYIRFKDLNIVNMYLPLFSLTIVLIGVLIVINFPKVSGFNILKINREIFLRRNITLFDYIIPFIIIQNSSKKKSKNSSVFFVFFSTFRLFLITMYSFMTVKGDLLYSLSPLQILFQISGTSLVRNFDALFNYLLYFSYFAALTALMLTYKTLKRNFSYFNNTDLLLIIPFVILISVFRNAPIALIEIILSTIILFGREKKNAKDIS